MSKQTRVSHPIYNLLPTEVEGFDSLAELALDMRWSWNHATDKVWRQLDPELWKITHNPWVVLQTVSRDQIERVLTDPVFRQNVDDLLQATRQTAETPAWFQQHHSQAPLTSVAYFSMEFMLSEALPIYSGGLGNVAGDQLKAASDLGVPVVGVGLLYQRGYFRHRERGNGLLAEQAFAEVLASDPQHADGLAEMGLLQLARRNQPKAAELLSRAVLLDQRRLGLATEHGLPEVDALKADKHSPLKVYNGLGVLADLNNDFPLSEAYYRLALRIDPRSALVQNSLGYSYYLAGQWSQAERSYRRGIDYDASYSPLCGRNYGLLLARSSRYEEALSAFEHLGSRAQASNEVTSAWPRASWTPPNSSSAAPSNSRRGITPPPGKTSSVCSRCGGFANWAPAPKPWRGFRWKTRLPGKRRRCRSLRVPRRSGLRNGWLHMGQPDS